MPIGSCGGHIILRTSSDVFISSWGCVLKGCFEKEIFWRAKSCLKGIEDFNLEDCLRPLHAEDWEPGTITLQAISLVGKAEPVQVHFTLRLRDQRIMCLQDGCKVYMDSYMALNGSCLMVTWTIFKNHLSEVGLTQNRQTMEFQTLTTVALFPFNMCRDPHE